MGSLNIDASTIEAIIHFLIAWGPTIFASIALIVGFSIGYKRGGRKSLILWIHAIVCFAICLTIYLILVESRDFDKFLLDTINKIMGSEAGLENYLGVSADCETLREVIIEFIPTQLSFMDGLELIAKDNGAYLLTIVDMVYRIVFALLLNIIYVLLIFIAYMIYVFFYSERKYMKKQNLDYQNNLRDGLYRKNSFLGGIIGLCRSFITVTLVLSFIGSFFFVVTGGSGEEDAPEPEFEDKTVSLVTSIYSSICEYGSQGIFKVLNLVKDEKEVPYYLYAADLIFQGRLHDDDIDKDVIFRDELSAYVGFARKTYDLIIKYGSKELIPIIEGKSDEDLMDAVVEVMSKKAFQHEFENIIRDFEKESYFINFALSLCESMIKNINDIELLSALPAEIREILQICFSPGYLSSAIPYEVQLASQKENDPFYEYQKDKYELGYLKLSSLITREDIIELLRALFDVINATGSFNAEETNTVSFTIGLVSDLIGHVQNLSIISTDRADEINAVLRRLYSYLEITYLSSEYSPETPETPTPTAYQMSDIEAPYTGSEYNEVLWVEEINILINIIKEGLNLFENNFDNISPDTDIMSVLVGMFEQTNEHYSENMYSLDYIITSLANSRILGEALSTSYLQSMISNLLSGVVSGYELPKDINYSNIYDKDGNVIEYGELYYLFSIVKKVVIDPEVTQFIIDLLDGGNSDGDTTEEIVIELDDIFELLNLMTKKGEDGLSTLDCVIDSTLIRSLLSKVLIDLSSGEEAFIYLDQSVLEVDENGQITEVIKLEELQLLFDIIPDLVPVIKDVIDRFTVEETPTPETQADAEEPEEESDIEYILGLLENSSILKLLDSKIVEGTLSHLAFSYLPEEYVVIPQPIKEHKVGIVTTNEAKSEIRKLISVILDTDIDINALLSEEVSSDSILGIITSLTEEDFELLFDSDILYYTIYNFLNTTEVEGIKIVIPNTVKVKLDNDVFDSIIVKEQLIELVNCLLLLLPDAEEPNDTPEIPENQDSETVEESNFEIGDILLKLVINKEKLTRNDVIVASLANMLANTDMADSLGDLQIPNTLKKAAAFEELTVNFGPNNPWFNELYSLVTALDEMLEISKKEEINLNDIESVVLDSITTLNNESSISGQTKLDLLYNSAIVTHFLTVNIDDIIVGNLLTEEDSIALKDYSGNYRKSEIASIIYLTKVFEITADELKGDDSSGVITEKVENGIGKLKEINDEGITHLQHLYKDKIFGMLLYNVVVDQFSVPTDALMTTPTGVCVNSVKYNEAEALITIVDMFGSIDAINAEEMDLALLRENRVIISKSSIISSHFYDTIAESNEVLIPYYALNDNRTDGNVYIKIDEFYDFLGVITDEEVADLLFNSSEGKYNLASIKSLEFESITTSVIRKLLDSTILEVTIIHTFLNSNEESGETDLSTLCLPGSYVSDSSKTRLLINKDNVWVVNKEMYNLTLTLDILGINNISDIDDVEDSVLGFLDGDDVFSITDDGREKLEVMYSSIIVSSAMSSSIDDILTEDLITDDIKNSKAVRNKHFKELYDYEEIKKFINSMKKLGLEFTNAENADINFTTFIENNKTDEGRKRNEEIYNSILIKGVLTTQLNNEISNGPIHINTHEKAYDEEIRDKYYLDLYKWGEIQALLDLFKNQVDEETGEQITDIKMFDIDKLDVSTIKEASLGKDENGNDIYISYLLAATLASSAKENLVVLKEDLEDDGLIKASEVLKMLVALELLGVKNINVEDMSELIFPKDDDPEQEEKLRTISQSNIVNATVAQNTYFVHNDASGKHEYEAKAYNTDYITAYFVKTDYAGNTAALIEENEFVKFGKTAAKILDEDGGSIDNFNLDILEAADNILDYGSQIMCNLLVEYLNEKHSQFSNFTTSNEGIYLTNCSSVTIYHSTVDEIKIVVALVRRVQQGLAF